MRFELTLYLLYAIGPTPKPLHYSGRYCPTATHIGHSISNNLISSYIRRKLAKTTNNRSEIKLAYATPFELQGQKNTTIHNKIINEMMDGQQKISNHLNMIKLKDQWSVV